MRISMTVVGLGLAAMTIMACGGEAKPAADATTSSGEPSAKAGGGTTEGSLEDRERWTSYQSDAAEWADKTSKPCGTAIKGSWNADTFKPHMAEVTKDAHTRGRCSAAFESLADICKEGDMQKQAAMKKIKSVECTWADKGKGGATVKDGKLIVSIETNADAWTPSYTDIIKKQL